MKLKQLEAGRRNLDVHVMQSRGGHACSIPNRKSHENWMTSKIHAKIIEDKIFPFLLLHLKINICKFQLTSLDQIKYLVPKTIKVIAVLHIAFLWFSFKQFSCNNYNLFKNRMSALYQGLCFCNANLLLIAACFSLGRTVLLLLKMVAEYCQCVEDIPTVSMDILTRLIEILQVFNTSNDWNE